MQCSESDAPGATELIVSVSVSIRFLTQHPEDRTGGLKRQRLLKRDGAETSKRSWLGQFLALSGATGSQRLGNWRETAGASQASTEPPALGETAEASQPPALGETADKAVSNNMRSYPEWMCQRAFHTLTNTQTHAQTHTQTQIGMHNHKRAHTHTHTHTHTHRHTHTHQALPHIELAGKKALGLAC